ncbi:MAG: radical SAM family heme chaperone HemW [Opitutaceae bacterium]|nr:radical SAM family heme chaperone HemW [Opitutaceae bacterium]
MSEFLRAREVGEGGNSALPGLYVHVPFCASTCDFCAFYQVKPDARKIAEFFDGIRREAGMVEWSEPIGTVFWGGGTPGLLSPDQMRRLGSLVRTIKGVCDAAEWTVELAPGSVTVERLAALKEIGVTRLSIGVQSFQPGLLDALGRRHTREQALRAYDRARQMSFRSVSLDLMFALPGQSEKDWLDDLGEAISLQPDHLSTYCLTFEEDTALWVKLSQGKVKRSEQREADLYLATWERLGAAGFGQYEVSNFARPGHACLHNLNTWQMHEWVGLGPSAASQHRGIRGTNIADLHQWRQRLDRGERMTEDRCVLTDRNLLEDALIFGLRMNAGVDWRQLCERFPGGLGAPDRGRAIGDIVERLESGGLLRIEGMRWALTDRGRLLADSVASEIMDAFEVAV